MKLNSLDYLGISKHFSEEEIMVQNTARDFSDNEIMPIIEEYYEKGKFPEHLISKFGELGDVSMTFSFPPIIDTELCNAEQT